MPLKTRIRNYVVLAAVILLMSIFLTLRICVCPETEDGCSSLATYEYYVQCLQPHWKSVIWDAVAVIGAVLVFKWFKGSPSNKSKNEVAETKPLPESETASPTPSTDTDDGESTDTEPPAG